MFCHRTPQFATECSRKQLLTQQGADAPEDASSKSGGFLYEERPENILVQEPLTASTYPLISVSCKYHPPSMSSHLSGMAREDIHPHYFSLSSDAAPDNFASLSGVAVYPVEYYMEMPGDCWVNTLTCRGGTEAQQINH